MTVKHYKIDNVHFQFNVNKIIIFQKLVKMLSKY